MKTLTTQLGAFALSAATIFLHSDCASATIWEPGDLTTYGQSLWGAPPVDPGAVEGGDCRRDVTVGPKIAHEVLPLGPSGYAERW